jgi:hypothetical protein
LFNRTSENPRALQIEVAFHRTRPEYENVASRFRPIVPQPGKMETRRRCARSSHAQLKGRLRNRSRFGIWRSVPSTATATSLNNLATLLLTQRDLMAAMPLFEYIHATALDPEHPDTAAALCIHRGGGRRQGEERG